MGSVTIRCALFDCCSIEEDFMSSKWSRRDVLQGLAASSTLALIPNAAAKAFNFADDDSLAEIQVTPVSDCTLRIGLFPKGEGASQFVSSDGSLAKDSW